MKLAEAYSLSSALPIENKPSMMASFTPLPFDRYITIQTGAGFPSKQYSYYNAVIGLIQPYLDTHGIKIVHLGAKDDEAVAHVCDYRGLTTIHQAHYCVRNALLHFGNDSWMAHAAGSANIPLVCLYGSTSPSVHGPYWKNNDSTALLESHRAGNRPSFSASEQPKTIDFIPPEDAAKAILKLLRIPHQINERTLFISPFSCQKITEVVPSSIPALLAPHLPLTIRMDLHFDENIMAELARRWKISIITNRPISHALLQSLRPQINVIHFEINESFDLDYVKSIRKSGMQHVFFSKRSGEELRQLRIRFFDIAQINAFSLSTRADFAEQCGKYLNKKLDISDKFVGLKFKTNRLIFKDDSTYLSLSHLQRGIKNDNIGGHGCIGEVIDDDLFWSEMGLFHVFEQCEKTSDAL